MRRRDDEAALGKMRAHQLGEAGARGGVERRGRLGEEPERPARDEEARERDAPPLPGREIGARHVEHMREIEAQERLARRKPLAAEEALPEGEVLGDEKLRLHPVAMADEMSVLRQARLFARFALEPDLARFRLEQAREDEEEARLARAIRAGE